MVCPGCSAEIQLKPDEAFCPICRHKIYNTQAEVAANTARENAAAAVDKARKWLLFVAIITVIWGGVQYALGRSSTEDEIAKASRNFDGVDPQVRDAALKAQMGMTWDEVVAHDRGQVTLLLVVNIALALCYFGLWWWAARNPLVPTVIALLLFLTVIGVNAVLSPISIAQGIIVKIFLIGALSAAISSAYKARRAAELIRPVA